MKRWFVVVLVPLLVGCGDIAGPIGPEPFDPPAVYVEWAGELLECFTGRNDPASLVASVRWMVADGFTHEQAGWRTWGEWDDGTIYLRADAVKWRQAVVHELTHQLLWGDPGHRDSRWRCAE